MRRIGKISIEPAYYLCFWLFRIAGRCSRHLLFVKICNKHLPDTKGKET